MKKIGFLVCLGFIFLAAKVAPAKLAEEWRYVQQVEVTQPGLIKFTLPVETLNAARPGLEDLRLFDPASKEVPYLLERPLRPEQIILKAKKFELTFTAHATLIRLETGMAQPIAGITLETAAPNFIKAVQIEGSTDGKDWQILAQGQPLFRQPYGASELRLNLPPAVWPFLRLTVDDRRSEPVTFLGAKLHAAVKPPPVEPLPVTIAERAESDKQTRLTLNLGGAHVTLANIQVEVSEPLFMRQVTAAVRIVSENEITERSIASGTIYRVGLEGQKVSGDFAIPIDQQVMARELFLIIDNQDNPPLTIPSVKAERRPVYLTFFAQKAGSYDVLSGNQRCPAPRYDLASLEASLREAEVTPLTLTPRADNPFYRPAEPLPEIQDLGTDLDIADWKFRKLVHIKQAGVQQLDIDLETLAGADRTLGDLRLLRAGKQRPYILERTSLKVKLTPQVASVPVPKRPNLSRWQIKMPHPGLPIKSLSCTTPTPLFQRQVLLYEQPTTERGELYARHLGQTEWLRTPSVQTKTLGLELTRAPMTKELILEIDNGDNPPLQLEDLQLYYHLTRLLFKAPYAPETHLYYGNKSAFAPHYDIALVAPQLLAAEKVAASLGPAQPLKKDAWGEAFQRSRTTSIVFWGALALVVVVLLILVGRLLPKTPPPQT